MNELITVNAQFMLSEYYLRKARQEMKSGNVGLSKTFFALYEESHNRACKEFKYTIKKIAARRKGSKISEKLRVLKQADAGYSGLVGWMRYKWQKWKFRCAEGKRTKQEKRDMKLNLLAEMVPDEDSEDDTSDDNSSQDRFNVKFTEAVVVHTLPSPPMSRHAQVKQMV